MIADFWSVVNNEFSVLEIYIQERDTMRIDATLISHCNNGITKVYYVGTELSADDQ